jgi:hypothetical protein
MRTFASLCFTTALTIALTACGARSQLILMPFDALESIDALDTHDVTDATDTRDAPDGPDACVPVDDRCGTIEFCNNGADDNCNGTIDEGCTCTPGDVQPCFNGPPGRRNVGACRDGAQRCTMAGAWGACEGGIAPREDVCNGQDNVCNGCSQQNDCPIMCPGPNDPRVPDAAPFESYPLRGELFYAGAARSWNWTVQGGPCDALSTRPSFQLLNGANQDAEFRPTLSGDYTVTLHVVSGSNRDLTCTWIVHVAGPGLRVEMCYPENTRFDLDLFLHRPNSTTPWYPTGATALEPNPDACSWLNCEATIRGMDASGMFAPRADWGYMPSPLSACVNGPHGDEWRALGFCANPRLDIDNNLQKATGMPENINVDQPNEGETFRVMVQNWTGARSHPLVNVYCSGRRIATYGGAMPPDALTNFTGTSGDRGVGAMWRVADVTTHVDSSGTTTCSSVLLHRPGSRTGYYVTNDDPRF